MCWPRWPSSPSRFWGWFVDDWSGATTLVVYWFETLAGSLIIAARIMVHRRWAPKRGHYRYLASATNRRSPSGSSFAAGFLMTSLIFTAAHGLFLAVIVFLLGRNGQPELAEISWRSVAYGCAAVVAFMCVDFAVDLLSFAGGRSGRSSRLPSAGSAGSSSSISR